MWYILALSILLVGFTTSHVLSLLIYLRLKAFHGSDNIAEFGKNTQNLL